MGRRRHGLRADYTAFRYGQQHDRKPYLSAPKRIFSGTKLDSVVKQTADAMRDWRLSPWEREAGTYQGIRTGLVAAGHRFPLAELEAGDIVRRAFNELGRGVSRRPSFIEGQRQYSEPREHCLWCRTPLDDEDLLRGARFCSDVCRNRAAIAAEELARWGSDQERVAAFYIARKAAVPKRACDHCGSEFQPASLSTRFCSPVCARHGREGAVIHAERPCEQCGTVFKPVSAHVRFCSTKCANQARRQPPPPPRTCDHCGESFTVAKASSAKRFCSRSCSGKASHAVTKPPAPD